MKMFTRFRNSPARVRRTTLAALAAVMMTFIFTACSDGSGGGGASTTDGANDTTQTDDTKTTDPTDPANPSNPTTPTTPAATYIGTKAPSAAKAVGDIVFSDGSATPYASGLTLTDDQKAKAIAVIFYVGTECSNNGASRTLGVGLAHNTSGLAWCTGSANAYDKNITTIQCIPSGSVGNYTFTDDKDGSDNLEQISTFFKNSDITDDTADAEKYPAFYFAKNYKSQDGSHVSGPDYADGWYLPTIAELFQIWTSKETVDAASDLCGGSQFCTGVYWSSSQHASLGTVVYELDFSDGVWHAYNYGKSSTRYSVCAVRAFN